MATSSVLSYSSMFLANKYARVFGSSMTALSRQMTTLRLSAWEVMEIEPTWLRVLGSIKPVVLHSAPAINAAELGPGT